MTAVILFWIQLSSGLFTAVLALLGILVSAKGARWYVKEQFWFKPAVIVSVILLILSSCGNAYLASTEKKCCDEIAAKRELVLKCEGEIKSCEKELNGWVTLARYLPKNAIRDATKKMTKSDEVIALTRKLLRSSDQIDSGASKHE